MENNYFGNFIFDIVKDFYGNTLLSNSKPQKNEWTVISALILQNGNDFKMICYSNGTKALPNKNYFNKNFQIFDCHSEIITLKCFKFFLIKCFVYNLLKQYKITNNKIEGIIDEKEFQAFEFNFNFFNIFNFGNNKISLKDNVHFHLYISAPPCGECSVKEKLRFGSKTLDECISFYELPNNINNSKEINNQKNKFRTKSIRSDYKKEIISFSLSCSDKIMIRNILGIQGKYLSEILGNIYLSTITISNSNESISIEDCTDGLNPLKRGILNDYNDKSMVYANKVYFIKENLMNNNIKQNDRNSQPFSTFWYFPSTIQKIDPSTGLKCGSRIDNLQNIDKLRPTISRYDLSLLLFEFAQFVCDNQKLLPDRNEIQNMVRKIQIIIHQNKFENLKLNIVDIFDEVTKEGKYNLIKKFILNTNRDISKFKQLKVNILNQH